MACFVPRPRTTHRFTHAHNGQWAAPSCCTRNIFHCRKNTEYACDCIYCSYFRTVATMGVFSLALLTLLLVSIGDAQQQLMLALEDNFDDFNLSLWKHELTLGGGGNWEFQYYTNNRSNSFVEDGILHIRPTLTEDEIGEAALRGGFTLNIWGAQPADQCTGNAFFGCERCAGCGGNVLNPAKSARIRTAQSFSFTYGKVEVRAKLPRGDWLWPAIWMLPTDNQYGNWPASGEIDIMESRGNSPSYAPGGYDTFGSTLHWGPHSTQNQFQRTTQTRSGQDYSAEFHTYGLIWNETYIGTYLDAESNTVLSIPINQSFWERGEWMSSWENPWRGRGRSAPFDRRFYLILNLAVGGTTGYFPDGHGKPWENTSPNAINGFYDARDTWFPTWNETFQIDFVRVWTYQDVDSTTPTMTTPTMTSTSSALGSFIHMISTSGGMTIICVMLGLGLLFKM